MRREIQYIIYKFQTFKAWGEGNCKRSPSKN